MNCFIVDDHPITVDGIKAALSLISIECLGTASNIQDSVIQILKLNPDLIIIDHYLHEQTGIDLIQKLEGHIPASRFILMSQLDSKVTLKQYLSKGVRAAVSKDGGRDELHKGVLSSSMVYLCPHFQKVMALESSSEALTPRELEVVKYVAQGKTNKEIGKHLSCSEFTVKAHKANIMRKLSLANSVEVGVWALKNKVL